MDPWLVGGVVTSLMLSGLSGEYFQDRNIYSVPVLTYTGGDRERMVLNRIFEEPARTPLKIFLPYGKHKPVRTLEGYFVSSHVRPSENARPGAYGPTFRNIYDNQGRITEKYEYYAEDGGVSVSGYYRYRWNDLNRLTEYQSYSDQGIMLEWRKFTYDSRGNLLTEDLLPGETSKARYAWTPEGKLASREVLFGRSYQKEYKASWQSGQLQSETAWIAAYQEEKARITYKYDGAGRLSEIFYRQTEPPADLQKEVFTYDGAGRVTQVDHYDKWEADELYLTSRSKFTYGTSGWTRQLQYDSQEQLAVRVERSYDPGGHLVRQEEFYPQEDDRTPIRRFTARYNGAGLPVEEGSWEKDYSTDKLVQVRKLLLNYRQDGQITLWEHWEGSGADIQISERRKYLYDPHGRLVRDECWNRDVSTGKLYLNWANLLVYDGQPAISARPEGYPFMPAEMDYTCRGPWTAQDAEGEPAYQFKN